MTEIAALVAHRRNYNRHSAGQVADLARSLTRFGQRKPVVVWRGVILAGHGLVEAARSLGWSEIWTAEAPAEWTEAEALAYVAADNELARAADPDEDALAALVAELGDVDEELARLAAGGDEALKRLLASIAQPAGEDPGAQIDKAEELREKWGVETGQLWALGEHRLVCGDCTDAAVVERVMGGERADMVFTDPPYGVEWSGKGGQSIEGDITGTLIPLMFADLPSIMAERCWVYVCGGAMNMAAYGKMFDRFLRTMPRIIVWDKGSPTINHNGYHFSIELIYYGFTKGAGALWFGSRAGEAATDIWRIPRPSNTERLHLTEKPVELPERAIGNSCPPGGIVWEPFSGSASTLIACERQGRRCRAVEIAPGYVAVALERWATMTGQTPRLVERATDFGNG